MKTVKGYNIAKVAETFSAVKSQEIIKSIKQLEDNLDTLRSFRIKIVSLSEFKKADDGLAVLSEVLRMRNDGQQVPAKTQDTSSGTLPRRQESRGRCPKRRAPRLSLVCG